MTPYVVEWIKITVLVVLCFNIGFVLGRLYGAWRERKRWLPRSRTWRPRHHD